MWNVKTESDIHFLDHGNVLNTFKITLPCCSHCWLQREREIPLLQPSCSVDILAFWAFGVWNIGRYFLFYGVTTLCTETTSSRAYQQTRWLLWAFAHTPCDRCLCQIGYFNWACTHVQCCLVYNILYVLCFLSFCIKFLLLTPDFSLNSACNDFILSPDLYYCLILLLLLRWSATNPSSHPDFALTYTFVPNLPACVWPACLTLLLPATSLHLVCLLFPVPACFHLLFIGCYPAHRLH